MNRLLMKNKCLISMLLSFVAIPTGLLLYYGLEDENWDYFAKGKFITNTEGYEYKYKGMIYHLGLMVSEHSLIAELSIVFSLISVIVHQGVMAEMKIKK